MTNQATFRSPPFAPGMRIGLFGGSFNPPHAGHRRASLTALKRLGLDSVWWLVTPGNPLKDNQNLPPLADRVAAAKAVANHPRLIATDVEAGLGARYTYDTIAALKRRCRGVTFVWIMGADNLMGFHRWQRWRDIAALVPIVVIARPGATTKGPLGKAARVMQAARLPESSARILTRSTPPAWVFLQMPLDKSSSTALRAAGKGLQPAQRR